MCLARSCCRAVLGSEPLAVAINWISQLQTGSTPQFHAAGCLTVPSHCYKKALASPPCPVSCGHEPWHCAAPPHCFASAQAGAPLTRVLSGAWGCADVPAAGEGHRLSRASLHVVCACLDVVCCSMKPTLETQAGGRRCKGGSAGYHLLSVAGSCSFRSPSSSFVVELLRAQCPEAWVWVAEAPDISDVAGSTWLRCSCLAPSSTVAFCD
jgi:hypothetical protein